MFIYLKTAIDFNVVNPSNNTFNRQKIIMTIFVNETKYIFEKNLKKNPLQNWLQKWLQTPLQIKLQTPLHVLNVRILNVYYMHVVWYINTDIYMHMSTKIFYNCLFQELTLIISISNCWFRVVKKNRNHHTNHFSQHKKKFLIKGHKSVGY